QFNVSLLDSMIAAQTQEATTQMMRGYELNWGAMPLSGVFETSDGALVMVGAFKADPVKDIGTALGIAGLEDDPRFTTHALRMQNKPALQALFMERFKTNTTAHWIGKLEAQDLLCAPVRTIAEALADEQATINGMIMQAPGVVETVKVVGSPIHMSDAPVTIRIPPAQLGQHTQEVLAEVVQARATAAEGCRSCSTSRITSPASPSTGRMCSMPLTPPPSARCRTSGARSRTIATCVAWC